MGTTNLERKFENENYNSEQNRCGQNTSSGAIATAIDQEHKRCQVRQNRQT